MYSLCRYSGWLSKQPLPLIDLTDLTQQAIEGPDGPCWWLTMRLWGAVSCASCFKVWALRYSRQAVAIKPQP